MKHGVNGAKVHLFLKQTSLDDFQTTFHSMRKQQANLFCKLTNFVNPVCTVQIQKVSRLSCFSQAGALASHLGHSLLTRRLCQPACCCHRDCRSTCCKWICVCLENQTSPRILSKQHLEITSFGTDNLVLNTGL